MAGSLAKLTNTLRLKIRNFSFCQRQLNSNSKLYLHSMRKNATNSLWIINFPNVFWQYFIKSFSYDTTGTHLYARRIYEMLKYCLSHVICPREMLSRKAVVNLKGFSTAIRLECSFLPQPVFLNVHEGGESPLALKWPTQLLLLVLYTIPFCVEQVLHQGLVATPIPKKWKQYGPKRVFLFSSHR